MSEILLKNEEGRRRDINCHMLVDVYRMKPVSYD